MAFSTILVLLGATSMAATATDAKALAGLMPAEAGGFKPAGPDETFDRDSLFSLIDGGAEVYRSLNVRLVLSRRYEKPGAPDIMADVFDMGSSADAFGAYHHDMREGPSAGVGQESEVLGGNLHFWKDRFFVSIVALRETADSRRTVLELARAIAAAIPRQGERPDLVDRLPPEGLVASQVHYFHDQLLLDRLTDLGDKNILGLGPKTEGVLARYRIGKNESTTCALLLVRYPTGAEAEQARKRLVSKRDIETRLQGRLLAVVLEVPEKAAAGKLLQAIRLTPGGKK